MTALLVLFLDYLKEVSTHCIFIFIDNIDAFRVGTSDEVNKIIRK